MKVNSKNVFHLKIVNDAQAFKSLASSSAKMETDWESTAYIVFAKKNQAPNVK